MIIKPQTKPRSVWIICGLSLLIFSLTCKSSLLINKSNSLPHKIYFLIKGKSWQKGDLVAIKNFVTKYTKNQHFTKRVMGVAGDLITINNDWVFINEQKIVKLKTKTYDNKQLHPIATQTVPQQYFFVIADHKDSFDSRYQEFGLVHKSYIEGKVYAVW